ncbi:MAG: class I SAM-dependent methyltransferase [Methanosphaera sp.]|nr:class I SAM-dependent methyltransferase [Methanosphaera sp.]
MNEKIDLSAVSETMLVPLYARARESKKKNPEFIDTTALHIMENIDYDFEKRFRESTNKMNFWGCCARTVILDRKSKEFIDKNPDCTVINLACGLDDRFSRVDNGKLKWYNIDFEDVITLREKLIDKHERVRNIASSAMDFRWIDEIEDKENVLVIAEGFLMYLEENEAKRLFDEIAEKFKKVELLIELMAKWMVKNQKVHDTTRTTGAVFKWGVDDSKDFEKLCPRYNLLADYNLTDKMKDYSPIFIRLIAPFLRSRNNRIAVFEKVD